MRCRSGKGQYVTGWDESSQGAAEPSAAPEQRSPDRRVDGDFFINVVEMGLERGHRDAKVLTDLPVGMAIERLHADLELAGREAESLELLELPLSPLLDR